MRFGHAYGGASPTNVANAANYYLVDVANGDGRKVDLLQGRRRCVHRGHHCGLGELCSLEKVKTLYCFWRLGTCTMQAHIFLKASRKGNYFGLSYAFFSRGGTGGEICSAHGMRMEACQNG